MGSCGRQVRVTFATKITKVIIGGRGAEEGVRRPRLEHFGWQNVKQVSGCLQSFDPVRWKREAWNRRERIMLLLEWMMRSALPFWAEV